MKLLERAKIRRGFKHGFRLMHAQNEWLTPLPLIQSLGKFDLDPCAPMNRPWPTAANHFKKSEDGLSRPWFGRVWLNPPYSDASRWLERLGDHGDGIALVFARTETLWFFMHIWKRASAVFFFRGRIAFCEPSGAVSGPAGAPSCLVAYGHDNVRRIRESGLVGKLIVLRTDSLKIG